MNSVPCLRARRPGRAPWPGRGRRLDHVPDVPPPSPTTPPQPSVPPELPTELPPDVEDPPLPGEGPPMQEPPRRPGQIIVWH